MTRSMPSLTSALGVTVSLSAMSCSAVQRSSETRTCRIGVSPVRGRGTMASVSVSTRILSAPPFADLTVYTVTRKLCVQKPGGTG